MINIVQMTFPILITKLKKGVNTPFFLSFIKITLIAILVLHFSIIFLDQLPDNPIKHQYKKELLKYVDPFFTQSWHLFSPNPINTNMSLVLRFKYFNKGKEQITEWVDVTEPIITEREDKFWSPAQRISKFLQSSMSDLSESHTKILTNIDQNDSLKVLPNGKKQEIYENVIRTSFGYKSICNYSFYVAENYFKSKKNKNIKFQFKIIHLKFPRFSKRKENYYDLKNYKISEIKSEFIELIR
jgi:hypothetical protein